MEWRLPTTVSIQTFRCFKSACARAALRCGSFRAPQLEWSRSRTVSRLIHFSGWFIRTINKHSLKWYITERVINIYDPVLIKMFRRYLSGDSIIYHYDKLCIWYFIVHDANAICVTINRLLGGHNIILWCNKIEFFIHSTSTRLRVLQGTWMIPIAVMAEWQTSFKHSVDICRRAELLKWNSYGGPNNNR